MSDWRDEAACVNDPIPFDTPDPEDKGATKHRREAQAVAVCMEKCKVRKECLDDALIHETQSTAYNIRGGKTPEERKAILRRRTRNKKKETVG